MVMLIDPWAVEPFHQELDSAKTRKLAQRMKGVGWKGRPLVAFRLNESLRAITGSHRLRAARIAGLRRIPVIVLTPDQSEVVAALGNWSSDDVEDMPMLSDVAHVLGEHGVPSALVDLIAVEELGIERFNKAAVRELAEQGFDTTYLVIDR